MQAIFIGVLVVIVVMFFTITSCTSENSEKEIEADRINKMVSER
jgi:uncharacterized membrane protein